MILLLVARKEERKIARLTALDVWELEHPEEKWQQAKESEGNVDASVGGGILSDLCAKIDWHLWHVESCYIEVF